MSAAININPGQWVDRYSDELYGYALSRVNDADTAKDLVQETFLSALNNLQGFRGESAEKTWLYSILKNKIVDHFRKKRNTQSIENTMVAESWFFEESGHWSEHRPAFDWEYTSTDRMGEQEFLKILEQCKQKMSSLQQAVFTLKVQEELESEMICKELNITSSNYWVILHRAKLQLRECLEKNWLKGK
ncbi:MAG: sigma-70 family RNA polymerase sigma factor [Bacteroidota bacterium]